MTQLGAYVGTVGDPNSVSQLASFTNAMGQAPTLLDGFMDQNQVTWTSFVSYVQYMISNAQNDPSTANIPFALGMPMKTVADSSADQAFKDIASGAHDAQITGVFQTFATRYSTMVLRPGWEMNGTWQPWAVTQANLQDFIAAFQHIADLAHSFTGMSIKVDWNPNVANVGQFPVEAAAMYPGDQYVDNIAIDQYGVGQGGVPDSAVFNTTGYSVTTAAQMAVAHGKPFALDETGAGPTDTVFPTDLAQAIGAVAGVSVDHVNIWDDPAAGNTNLFWSGTPSTAAAWKAAFASISGSAPPPPPPPNVTNLSVILESHQPSHPNFIVKVDSSQIGSGTVASSKPVTFSFQDALAAGQHTFELDYTSSNRQAATMTVDQVTIAGATFLQSPDVLRLGGNISLPFTT